jgi:hypothetical protein
MSLNHRLGRFFGGNNKENPPVSPINGAFNPCHLPPPGVNAWARERSSFKLDYYDTLAQLDSVQDSSNEKR